MGGGRGGRRAASSIIGVGERLPARVGLLGADGAGFLLAGAYDQGASQDPEGRTDGALPAQVEVPGGVRLVVEGHGEIIQLGVHGGTLPFGGGGLGADGPRPGSFMPFMLSHITTLCNAVLSRPGAEFS